MYCVANFNGELIAHDIDSLEEANLICDQMQQEEPEAEWEVIEY